MTLDYYSKVVSGRKILGMSIINGLISIIVSVYNAEKYLNECISSIVKQSYSDLEIILIDDGSADSSGIICDKWAFIDSRITVVHQANGGLSSARNAGIDLAKGEYICFIDSDDCVTREFVDDLYRTIKDTEADLAFCDMNSPKLCDSAILNSKSKVLTADECRNILCDNRTREYVLMVVACNKMFSRSLFDDDKYGKVRFIEGKYHEDEFMINNYIYRISRAVYLPHKNYIYRDNESGITGENNSNDLRHLDVIDAYIERINAALNNRDLAFATQTFKLGLLKLASFYRLGDAAMKRAVINKYRDFYFKYMYLFDIKKKAKYGLFRLSPKVFCFIWG